MCYWPACGSRNHLWSANVWQQSQSLPVYYLKPVFFCPDVCLHLKIAVPFTVSEATGRGTLAKPVMTEILLQEMDAAHAARRHFLWFRMSLLFYFPSGELFVLKAWTKCMSQPDTCRSYLENCLRLSNKSRLKLASLANPWVSNDQVTTAPWTSKELFSQFSAVPFSSVLHILVLFTPLRVGVAAHTAVVLRQSKIVQKTRKPHQNQSSVRGRTTHLFPPVGFLPKHSFPRLAGPPRRGISFNSHQTDPKFDLNTVLVSDHPKMSKKYKNTSDIGARCEIF